MANTYRQDIEEQNSDTSKLILAIDAVNKNPSAIQRVVLQTAEDMLLGTTTIVDPTNPFVYLCSVNAASTASFVIENESSERRLYPNVAQTEDDLYYHMSDKDYLERFASPVTQNFWFMVSLPELESRLVLDPITGNRTATIPRYSYTTVNDYTFSMLYSIEIIQYSHGSWSVLYKAEDQHPLLTIATNEIPYKISKASASEQAALIFEATLVQTSIATQKYDVNSSTGFKKRITFIDQYCFARVFYKNTATAGLWREMVITHSDFTYDASKPTALLKVLPGTLEVVIPQIYLNNQTVTGSVRVDVYSTKGEMSLNTQNLTMASFESDWSTIDSSDQTEQVAAWQAISNKACFARAMIAGGKNPDSFEVLRQKVIDNTVGSRKNPITDAQIKTALQNEGFEIVKYVDLLTERQFLATRSLPKSFDEKLITPGNASVETVISSLDTLIGVPGVLDNGERITLTPDVVYKNTNGVITPLNQAERDTLSSMTPDILAQTVTASNYLFSPFHYVLDPLNNEFQSRPYYMDDPVISGRVFMDQNDRTGLQVGTQTITLQRSPYGYSIVLITSGNDAWRSLDDTQAHVQMSFIPTGETARAFINAELVGRTNDNNFIFQFNLDSSFDITAADELLFKSFKIVNLENRDVTLKLLQDFDLVYSSSALMPVGWLSHFIDSLLGGFLLPNRIAAVTHERISVGFGQRLKNLWSAARSFSGGVAYRTYDADVYSTYDADVYEVDPLTGLTFKLGTDGTVVFNKLLHAAGETVMQNGTPVIKYKKGVDLILDASGNPIPQGDGKIVRQFDLFFIEGAYYFATDFSTRTYREQMIKTVVRWITQALNELSSQKLEQTSIFFYPKTSMGTIRGIVADGQVAAIDAAQSFAVKYYVTKEVNENTKLKDTLTTTAIKFIYAALSSETISMSAIIKDLEQATNNDSISVAVTGLGGSGNNYDVFTSLDERQRCSIRKRLFAQPDGELIVREDVSVEFIQMKK